MSYMLYVIHVVYYILHICIYNIHRHAQSNIIIILNKPLSGRTIKNTKNKKF